MRTPKTTTPMPRQIHVISPYSARTSCAMSDAATSVDMGPSTELPRDGQKRVQQDVRAALDRTRVARLVGAMALATHGRNEDHAGLRHGREVLRIVAGREIHPLRAEP